MDYFIEEKVSPQFPFHYKSMFCDVPHFDSGWMGRPVKIAIPAKHKLASLPLGIVGAGFGITGFGAVDFINRGKCLICLIAGSAFALNHE